MPLFQKGNKFSKGRKPKSAEQRLLEAGTAAITPKDLQEVLAKLIELAKRGDVAAIRTLLTHLYGSDPVLTRSVTSKLLAEIERYESEPGSQETVKPFRPDGPPAA